MIRGTTQLYLMAGYPVAQVKSPAIFNRRFAQTGFDAALVPVEVRPADLPVFVDFVRKAGNVRGAIVTVPHKERITAFVDRLSGRASVLRAANVLRKGPEGELRGDTLDGEGFVNACRVNGHVLRGRRLLVLGCGGAGSAAAWEALENGAAGVFLLDIRAERARSLAETLTVRFPGHTVRALAQAPQDFDLVLNATPLGMRAEDPLPLPVENIPPHAVVADAVTAAELTPWLRAAAARGHAVQTGVQMAEAQAASIAAFFGIAGFAAAACDKVNVQGANPFNEKEARQ